MGLKQEIEKHRGYKNLSYKKLIKIIEETLFTQDTSRPKHPKETTWRKLPESFDLDFQIQDGWMYTCQGDFTLFTGSGGIRDIINAMRKEGIADSIIAQGIFIHYNKEEYWIGDIVWKKIEKD